MASVVLAAACLGSVGCTAAEPTAGSTAAQSPTVTATSSSGAAPSLFEDFTGEWTGFPSSPDGRWRIAGDWTGTGGNLLEQANASISAGRLSLTSRANSLRGAEIQTVDAAYGHGYYVVRMRTAKVAGVCQSFFWKAEDYAEPEIDFEFLTGGVTNGKAEDWVDSADRGRVHVTAHPLRGYGNSAAIELGFNPSNEFHDYGFLWTPEQLVFTVDGQVRATFTKLPPILGSSAPMGFIMANTWTGNPGWGGGPPTSDATAEYEWIKFYRVVTEIPGGAG